MFRFFFHFILPLLLPTLIYVSYVYLRGKQGPEWVREGPWLWLALAGVVLMVVGLLAWGMTGGVPPGMDYLPAQFQEGTIVKPGRE
ncbi:MAG: DUF6111 family protein [Geminicoccaceae bacterium]